MITKLIIIYKNSKKYNDFVISVSSGKNVEDYYDSDNCR